MYNNYKTVCLNSISNNFYSNFIKKFHYKKSLARGCKYNYCLFIDNKLAGIACYGIPSSKNYNGGKIIELKRFTLSPRCLKNTASWFMSKCEKLLPKEIESIISYAESDRHEGTIYKASNFTFMGQGKRGQAVMYKGKQYHLKAVYQKIKGKPTKTSKMIKDNLKCGKAKWVTTSAKNIYIYKR